jgi:hypothetical protein
MSEADVDKLFEFIVKTHSNGDRTFQVSFDDLEADEAEDDEGTTTESFDSDDAINSDFRRLWCAWVRTGIAFFEFVPKLSEASFRFDNDEVVTRLSKHAELVCVGKETREDGANVTKSYRLPYKQFPILTQLLGTSSQAMLAASVMKRSALGALLAEYEYFLLRLLKLLAKNNPQAFLSDDAMISIGRLADFSSLEQAQDALIEEKIERLLQENSHLALLKWIEKAYKVNLTSDKQLIADFVEIC